MLEFSEWFAEWVAVLRDIANVAVAVAAVVALFYAYKGLTDWREELKATTRLEIARRIVSRARRFGKEMEATRTPFTFARESVDREKNIILPSNQNRILDSLPDIIRQTPPVAAFGAPRG